MLRLVLYSNEMRIQEPLNPPTRVLLIDDHAMVRGCISLILNKMPNIEVVGEAETGWQGVKLAKNLKPSLVILDFKLPDISGLEVTQRLIKLEPLPKIMILTSETHDLAPAWLLAAGAQGFLAKSASTTEFKQAVQNLIHNQVSAGPERSSTTKKAIFNDLSFREIEIMRMMIRGNTVEGIANQLYIDTKTIYAYRSEIFKKLKVKNVVGLTLLALRHGIMELEDL